MRAIVQTAHGGPEVFTPSEVPEPELRPGHLIVKVEATSLNPVDAKLRATKTGFSLPTPAVLHGDVAGTVLAVAADVSDFRPGDCVYGCAGGLAGYAGALAERMLVDAALMAPMPGSLNFRTAASLPLVAITAWEALVDKMRVGPGTHLLVFGATGGVGSIAVQLGKHLGARITATCSAAKASHAETLGADVIAFHDRLTTSEIVAAHTGGRGFDAVIDTVGGKHLQDAFAATANYGQVVSLARGEAEHSQVTSRQLSHHGVFMLLPLITGQRRAAHGKILRQVAALVDTGRLTPLLDPTPFSLWDAEAAHRRYEARAAIGKITLALD